MRLSMSSFAGTARTLVAVGTVRRRLHVGDRARGGTAQDGRPHLRRSTGTGAAAGTTGSSRRGPARSGGVAVTVGTARDQDLLERRGASWVAISASDASSAASTRRVRRAAPRWTRRPLGAGVLGRDVVLEEVPPRRVDALRVGEVLLVDLVDEPLVGPERRKAVGLLRLFRRRHRRPFTAHRMARRRPGATRSAYAVTVPRRPAGAARRATSGGRRRRSGDVAALGGERRQHGEHGRPADQHSAPPHTGR